MADGGSEVDASEGGPESTSPEGITPGYANYVLGVLFLVYVVNFIDRQVMSVFIGPIKEEFQATDTQMGALVGFAFALFYTIAGIPIARWADRGNRRSIIALGLALWSAMTVASGLARSFTTLALARVFVGVGEAAGSPPSHSLISDYFPRHKRATALGIYAWGVYVGSAIAYLFGAALLEYFDWRTAFIVLGTPGLFVALLVRFTVREPPRGVSETAGSDAATSTLAETIKHLCGCSSWLYLMTAASFMSITGYGVLMWGFQFYGRVHGMSHIPLGVWMAIIVGLGGSLGTFVGGTLCDRLGASNPGWYLRLPAIATLASVPLALIFLLVDSSTLSLSVFLPFYVLANMYVPAMNTINQNLAKLRMRATAAAIMLFILNIVCAGFGPLLVGILTDYFTPEYGAMAIRYSLTAISLTSIPAALCFYLASRSLASDLERLRS